MRTRSLVLIAGLAIAGLVDTGTSAVAQPIDKGHFHDVFTDDSYSCDGLPAQDSGDISGNFVVNQRGSSPFPYFRESVRGTFVTTNLLTPAPSPRCSHPSARTTSSPTTAAGGPTTSSESSCSRIPATSGLLRRRLRRHPRRPLGRHRDRRLVPGRARLHRGQRHGPKGLLR